jgi:hypothetical protein
MSIRTAIAAAVAALVAAPLALAQPVQPWRLAQPLASTELDSPAARSGHRLLVDTRAMAADTLELPLPGGPVQVRLTTRELREHGALWRGHVVGEPQHPVSLTWHRGRLAGLLSLADATWEIAPEADARSRLLKIDHGLYPECSGTVAAQAQPAAAPEGTPDVPFRDASTDIDVIIFYTAAARVGADGTGDPAAIQATAQAAVDAANLAFSQSNLASRFKLVAALELDFTESGNASTDLSAFRANATVNAARDAYLADQSGLLVENGGGGCGIGYLMTSPGPGFAGSAFQVTARTCAVGNLTYAHEHGHNMGMAHNPENGSSAAHPFAFGHWNNTSAVATERFRTVLSYSNPCTTANCTRRPYFSNPLVQYMGQPTGIADQRDNARNMELVTDTVANWRIKTILRHGFD